MQSRLTSVSHCLRDQFKSANEDEIYNLLNKAIMNTNDSNNIFRNYMIGQHIFKDFVGGCPL